MTERYVLTKSECLYELRELLNDTADENNAYHFWHDYSYHMFTTCNECPCSIRFNDTECAWVEGDMYMIARYLV